jgi:hypothetical protein
MEVLPLLLSALLHPKNIVVIVNNEMVVVGIEALLAS